MRDYHRVRATMEITSNSILRPSSPHDLLNHEVHLSIFDMAAFNINIPILYVYPPPTPKNSAIKEGLQKALSHFPHLAGRFATDNLSRQTIYLNNAGARVIETFTNAELRDSLPLRPTTDLQKLYPEREGVEELLQVQLNRFSCGGLVIGLTAHHRVADGQSMNTFFTSWARLVKGLDVDPLPYHDRAAICIPRNPRKVEFNHREIEFRVANSHKGAEARETPNLVVRFSVNFVNTLKEKLGFQPENPNKRYSTFQCLLTHVWKKLTLVRKVSPRELTKVKIAVNGRARIKPRVPMGYFGNLVLWAYPKMMAGELISKSYREVADVINDAVSKVNGAYFQSFIDFGNELTLEGELTLEATVPEEGFSLTPDMEVDSWLSFQYHELDFGGGGPIQVLTYILTDGLGIFSPASDEKGAVDFHVALLPHQVEAFKSIAHELD